MIDIPQWPGPTDAVPRVLDFGGFLEAPGGAPTQRANQLGNRYAVAFTYPPMGSDKEGRIFVNRLVRGLSEGVRVDYPLGDFAPGTPNVANGSPIVVDGVGQAGVFLAIQNVQPAYGFVEGQPVSLEVNGQHYLDFVAQNAIAGADGKVTIRLSQMLRVPPTAGSVLHVAKPMIEGFLMGSPPSWKLALERQFEISFEIHESR